MFEKLKVLLKQEKGAKRPLLHLAITMHGIEKWAEENKKAIEEAYKLSFDKLKELTNLQIEYNIPILTIYLLPEELKKQEYFISFIDEFVNFFNYLKTSEIIHKNKVKISALGKWYNIPSRGVDAIKSATEETKDYDTFFLNFCINYNGQEEIVDACKLIARQIKADKLDIDAITKETIKDNIYSSYFLPPNLIIENGERKQLSGLLLWDSIYADIIFTKMNFIDLTAEELLKIIIKYKES
jgi:undecaprenyl diphosphate synthase